MKMAFARQKLEWQQLTSEQLNDILTWLRTLPETQHLVSRFSNASGDAGLRIFEQKGCVKCHVGNLALENRLHNMTLTDIAVDMWNHAPRMAQQVPTLARRNAPAPQLPVDAPVRRRRGQSGRWQTRLRRGAVANATTAGPTAPAIARQGASSEVTVISAIWRHGPQMLNRMQQAKSWPQFANPQELVNLIAYLNSIQ